MKKRKGNEAPEAQPKQKEKIGNEVPEAQPKQKKKLREILNKVCKV